MDSYICLKIFDEIEDKEFKIPQIQHKREESKDLDTSNDLEEKILAVNSCPLTISFKQKADTKFFVDNMLRKLCYFMRNYAIDTEFCENNEISRVAQICNS